MILDINLYILFELSKNSCSQLIQKLILLPNLISHAGFRNYINTCKSQNFIKHCMYIQRDKVSSKKWCDNKVSSKKVAKEISGSLVSLSTDFRHPQKSSQKHTHRHSTYTTHTHTIHTHTHTHIHVTKTCPPKKGRQNILVQLKQEKKTLYMCIYIPYD